LISEATTVEAASSDAAVEVMSSLRGGSTSVSRKQNTKHHRYYETITSDRKEAKIE